MTWRMQPPFWYKGDTRLSEPNWPVGNPDDYRFKTLSQPLADKTLLEELEVERLERYLPGEIYRNERPKRPIEDLSKAANCSKIWTPKHPNFCREFQPTPEMLNPPLLLDGVLQRKAESANSNFTPDTKYIGKCKESCEGVEDLETKAKKRIDYLEALKNSDTRPENFKCTPDTKIDFENSCKISDKKG